MSESNATQDLRLQTVEAFFEALYSSEMELRLATLTAIREAPDKALAFGRHRGQDVIDVLVSLVQGEAASALRLSALASLLVFDDVRALNIAKTILVQNEGTESMSLAIAHVARGPEAVELLDAYLWDLSNNNRSRLAAQALADHGGLSQAQALRVALLAGETGAVPPMFSEATMTLWMDELAGPLKHGARVWVESLGVFAFELLRPGFEAVSTDAQVWMLQWGCRTMAEEVKPLVLYALKHADPTLRMEALKSAVILADPECFGEAVAAMETMAENDFESLRIKAGLPVPDPAERLRSESQISIRLALIQRMSGHLGFLEQLGSCLSDGDWRIRSAATDAITAMGEPALAWARNTQAMSSSLEVRTAVAQILARLGHLDWITPFEGG